MMKSLSPISLFLSFFLIFSCVSCFDLIACTCNKIAAADQNINYNFCIATLKADPKSRTADLKGLGSISINLNKARATYINSYVKNLLNKGGDVTTKQCLQYCSGYYSDAVYNVNTAIKDLYSGDYQGANIKISAAMAAPADCEDEFKNKRLLSPVTKQGQVFFQISAICLYFTNIFD
ncbi:hypothetical protein GIB67_037580 [Kingdonia uniflora]|uniref:Pectinesterase inhibitor domain-containing protein n=1 Tax=Kingdonia uniflora TaxID=39325 RepID=A0A7J7LSJ4_9MAGN|nr:hypothetical protein GIB67_037580 [Kingdonia uniflora]